MGRSGDALSEVGLTHPPRALRPKKADHSRFSGTEQAIKDSVSAAKQVVKSSGCQSFESATSQEAMDSLWSARKQALWASLAVRPEGTEVWSTDVAVPISRMADIISKTHPAL